MINSCFSKYVKYNKIVRDYIIVYIKEHFFELTDQSDDDLVCFERYGFLYFIHLIDGEIVFSDENNSEFDKVRFKNPNDLFKYLHSRFA